MASRWSTGHPCRFCLLPPLDVTILTCLHTRAVIFKYRSSRLYIFSLAFRRLVRITPGQVDRPSEILPGISPLRGFRWFLSRSPFHSSRSKRLRMEVSRQWRRLRSEPVSPYSRRCAGVTCVKFRGIHRDSPLSRSSAPPSNYPRRYRSYPQFAAWPHDLALPFAGAPVYRCRPSGISTISISRDVPSYHQVNGRASPRDLATPLQTWPRIA